MPGRSSHSHSQRAIARVFRTLDYELLGPVYCDAGGEAFWRVMKGRCQRIGTALAYALHARVSPGGRSLYVGAGVPELPVLAMETMDLGRTVEAYNLRRPEVAELNRACHGLPVRIRNGSAVRAAGRFDHLWIVSVLNDPERYPELSSLSYGRAHPAVFDTAAFNRDRRRVRALAHACLSKLCFPALVTTSVEEIMWISEWCHARRLRYVVEEDRYPAALVGDPICFIRIARHRKDRSRFVGDAERAAQVS